MQVPLTTYTDAEKTHPADDPYYPSPFRGLLFGKEGDGILSREGALYLECDDLEQVAGVNSNIAGYYQGELLFTSDASHTWGLIVHPAKEVICPGIGVFRGSSFRSILTGPNDGVEGAPHLFT
jgi:hypothetical protein